MLLIHFLIVVLAVLQLLPHVQSETHHFQIYLSADENSPFFEVRLYCPFDCQIESHEATFLIKDHFEKDIVIGRSHSKVPVSYKNLLTWSDPVTRKLNVTLTSSSLEKDYHEIIEVPYIEWTMPEIEPHSFLEFNFNLNWKVHNKIDGFYLPTFIICTDERLDQGWNNLTNIKVRNNQTLCGLCTENFSFYDFDLKCWKKHLSFVVLGEEFLVYPIGSNIFQLNIYDDSYNAHIDYLTGNLNIEWGFKQSWTNIGFDTDLFFVSINGKSFPLMCKVSCPYVDAQTPLLDMDNFREAPISLNHDNFTFDYKEWPKLSLGAVKLFNFGEDLSYYLPHDFTYFPKVYVSGSFLQPVVMKCDNDVIDSIDATSPWPQPETLSFVIPISCHNKKLSVSIEGLQTLTFAKPLLVLPRNTSIEPVHYELDGNKLIISWNHPSFCVASRALPVAIEFGSKSVEVDICKVSKTEISNFKEGLAINWHSRFDRIANQVILNSYSNGTIHFMSLSQIDSDSNSKEKSKETISLIADKVNDDGVENDDEKVVKKNDEENDEEISLTESDEESDTESDEENETESEQSDEDDEVDELPLQVELISTNDSIRFQWKYEDDSDEANVVVKFTLKSMDNSSLVSFDVELQDQQLVVPINALSGASHWQWSMEYEGVEMQVLSDSKQFCIAVPLNVTLNVDGWLSWNDMSCLLPDMDYNAKVLYGDLELFIIESIRQSNRILLTLPEQPWQYDIVFQSHLQSSVIAVKQIPLIPENDDENNNQAEEQNPLKDETNLPIWLIAVISLSAVVLIAITVAFILAVRARQRKKKEAMLRAFGDGKLHIFQIGPLENIVTQ